MRVLHVPVEFTSYDNQELHEIISKYIEEFPGLQQIVLHFGDGRPPLAHPVTADWAFAAPTNLLP